MARPADPTTKRVWALPALPARPEDSHKGDYGRVVVAAGSAGMGGAAVLASQAALRAGAGRVTCACPQAVLPFFAPFPCVMTAVLEEAVVSALASKAEALCVGPGLGKAPETASIVRALLAGSKAPAVVDADALAALDASTLAALKDRAVLTPHPGEMASLTGSTVKVVQTDRRELAKDYAGRHGLVVVLKGHGTVVTDGLRLAVNATGNAGMATAGTGDVLSGVIAALLAQGMQPFEAAYLGVYLHGLAGDLAAKEKGLHSLIATDVLDCLPSAFGKHSRS